jgi:1-acyl-sn-glycerol-3-phosphate acyltransferase
MREGLFSYPLFWIARGFLTLCLVLKYRMRITGRDHVPREGGAVIAANHCSYLDPPVLAACSSRRIVRFMARDTLMSNRVARWFFPRVAIIPLDRTRGDLGALRKALASLKEGKVIGLFPEGTRSPDGKLQQAKGGIGFLLAKAEVPVVPVHIAGTYEAFPKGAKTFGPSRIRVRLGSPIHPDEIRACMASKSDYESVGALVMDRIRNLAEEP